MINILITQDMTLIIYKQISLFRYIGKTHFSEGYKVYGIELDKESGNGSNGTINDKQYFQCKAGHGYFVKLDELFVEDEEIQDVIKSVQKRPKVGDVIKTFDGKQGTVRFHIY